MAKKSKRKAERVTHRDSAQGAAGARARTGRGGGDSGVGTAPPIPGWLPPVVFVGLGLLIFRAFVFSDRMLFGSDTLGLGYVARAFYADALTTLGTFPRWAPLILGGTPFIEALSAGDSLYPPSVLLLLVTETYRALGWKLVLHFIAAGFFMFGWLRAIGASRPASLLGGVAYLLAPYFVSLVAPGHDGKIFVTALAPLLFWAVERHFVAVSVRTVASIALVIGLILLTTHFQMAYFLFGAVGMYAIFRSIQLGRAADADAAGADAERAEGAPASPSGAADAGEDATGARPGDAPTARVGRPPAPMRAGVVPFALFLLAAVLGAGVAAVQLVPAVDYVSEYSRRVQTTREAAGEASAVWSSSWSLHPEDLVAMVVPEFNGNNSLGADWSQGTYWGRNGHKDNHESVGLVILLLATASFFGGARRGLRFFFLGLGLLALLFALGAHTPVWGFFYAVVPGIRLFRAPSQVMFLFAFAASTLGALGLDRLLALGRGTERPEWTTVLRTLVGVSAGLGLLAMLASSGALTSFWTSVVYTDLAPQQAEALRRLEPFIGRGAGISLLLGLTTTGAVWAFRSGRLGTIGLVAVMVFLVAADEYRISSGFVRTLDFAEWSAPDGFTAAVLQRESEAGATDPYRMLSLRQVGQDVDPALHGIELAAGHHPNDLSRYRELIGMVGSGFPTNLLDSQIRRLLNIRYVLWPDYAYGQAFGPPETVLARSQLQDGTPYETLHVEAALPRARLVGGSVVKSDEEAVDYMLTPEFDPAAEVVLAEPPPIELDGAPPTGTVEWVERTPNWLELAVETERPALLVVADNWYPAWQATVDGGEAPVLRAYHTLRAVPVPAGRHTIEMVYRSGLVGTTLWVSVLLTLALTGALAIDVVRARRTGSRP